MHSRAFMLLRRDLVNLQRFPLTGQGITAEPTHTDNLFHWSAKIEGLGGTVWEGGVFQVTLSFTEEFNTRPPEIHFMTIPFHPNVNPHEGTPSGNMLGEGWSEDCTVSSILMALQALLSNPELDGGCILNTAAARLLRDAPHTYKQMALDCVTASLRIDAGLPPYEREEEVGSKQKEEEGPSPQPKVRRRKRRPAKPISFDDYHTLWKGIATSVTTYNTSNPFIQLLDRDSHLQSVHCANTKGIEKHLEQRMEEHALLRHGNFKNSRPLPKLDPRARVQRIEHLKQLYRDATKDSDISKDQLPSESGDEVEEMVQWTKNLDEIELNS